MSTGIPQPIPASERNSSGLPPSETKTLPERQMKPNEGRIIGAIREMYSCNPTKTTFNIYANDAVFHDPVGIAKGVGSIRNQFVGLAKIFGRADLTKFRLLENPPSIPPNTILIDQDVAYYHDSKASSPTKVVNSLLTIKYDSATNQVTSHNEDWNHKKTSTAEDGLLGWMNEQRKKITAKLTDAIVGEKN